ncbi:hypothetical protein Desku_1564 [Desulfofundulus kuznetsovii DSM 6115]|uniref:Uncharacterized protein n=1 Tax=Desulfofundulus kuznetsovii (strain DSM 6115 / VKM B-1805 / 17) TaxID=760568 RepID=A0AAU8PPW3_DESK7|nr:hypothetical protein Desku_1564 [Desulfofundulus kuznetsovii DSM 6115]
MRDRKVMLYLEEFEYRRLKELAGREGKSMNAFVVGLIRNFDMPKRKAAECSEYRCRECGRAIWVDVWQTAAPPTRCPWCGGKLADCGRWGTVVLGRVE